ncbi:cellulose binding domain-containing protein [Micromonospora sp. WMMD712]|uniref:cellulose binding domain-containing protein n=1 Tax=Micromonospora sp. WMMD712 TaxID=3016096 RepID=UPI00249B5195|nr:cellulose binding domain-containing protein [Micromonospora sp. WMMD712]WFE57498.1 cellulose binding domain-containing protein [Micromonospora sp. WMMD712]
MSVSRRRSIVAAGVVGVVAMLAATLLGLPPARAATGDGSPTDPNIVFVGRWDRSNSTAYVPNWAGAYLRTGFTGTTVKLRQRRTIDLYYSIDGADFTYLTNVSGTVNLTPTPLRAGNHTLLVSYRVVGGSYTGDAVFQGLTLDSGATTLPTPVRPRLIEFVGDSITLGTTSSRVALTAYGWLTGEQLGTEHTQLGYGGGCLVATADGCVSVAAQFLKTGYAATSPNWDFSRYQADAVVINLGTNDRGHGVSGADFQSQYATFIRTVRGKYPRAAIFALRTFSGRYAAETAAAVAAVTGGGDRNVFYVDTTGWLPADGLSDSVHPNDAGHRAIAARLAPVVAAKLGGTPTPATTPPATTPPATTPPATTPPATTPPATTPPAGTTGCFVGYAVTGQWQGGFQGEVTVRNTGAAPVDGWTVQWTFADGQRISQAWNAGYTQSGGTVRATNASWNGTIAAGATVSFGFLADAPGANNRPTAFTLNGTACALS